MLPPQLIETIKALHAGPERGYHAWSHPAALLDLMEEVRDQLSDPAAVRCAILLHDAIYDAKRSDNERRSAALAADLLAGHVPAETIRRAVRLIEATERHEVPPDVGDDEASDARFFLDLDLSILGADARAFDAYEAGVRHEHQHVPDAAFRAGRAAILGRFLARDRLYLSDWGIARFETQARQNLARSLAALRAA